MKLLRLLFRAFRLVALAVGCFLLTCIGVLLVVFWPVIREHVGVPKFVPAPPRAVTVAQPAPSRAPPEVERQPAPRRRGTQSWKAVDATFEQSRAARDQHPGWKSNLADAYEVVAKPAFTDAVDLQDHCANLFEWQREMPESATALVALARAYLDWAWEARGYSSAATVNEQDWQLFQTRVAEARRLLEQAIAMGVKDGEAHRLLILVGMAENQPYAEVRKTLDEGQRIDPTYFSMYVQFARYLLPRWHGQRGDIEHFAAEIAKSLPGDDGLEAYARIAAKIHKIDAERELVFFGEYDKPLLAKAAEVQMRRHEGSEPELQFAALCAWVAQDRETALRVRPLIEASAENDAVWPWAQQRAEFRFWCDRKEFAPTDETRWFWGSMFYGENLEFWKDSRSIWCGGGYGPSAMNRLEIEKGRIVQSLPALAPGVDCFALDNAKDWVAAGLTGSLYKGLMLWDLAEPNDPWAFPTNEKCNAIAIQPNKPQIAWATMTPTGAVVRLTNVRTGQHTASFRVPGYVRRLRFSADGQSLVVSTDRESIWSPEAGQLQHDLPHVGMRPIPSELCKKVLQIDEQGRIWAIAEQTKPISGRHSLIRYAPDTKTWETLIADFPGDFLMPGTAVLSADERLLAVNTIRQSKEMPAIEIDIWNIESRQKTKHFSGHFSGLRAMSFSRDGKWLASMGFPTGLVRLWSLDSNDSHVDSR